MTSPFRAVRRLAGARHRARVLAAEPYKRLMGLALAAGLRANHFGLPPDVRPPPTPARVYIGAFLERHRDLVRGRVLEFAPPFYQPLFAGAPGVTSYDVWDTKEAAGATVVGDLQAAPHVPDGSFDTILCTHVLCCVPRPWLATAEMHRMLAPGGVVLVTNPMVLQNYAPHPTDCWRITPDSTRILLEDFARVEVETFGNAATVAGSPLYLMSYHFPRWVMRRHDPDCPSVVAAVAWK